MSTILVAVTCPSTQLALHALGEQALLRIEHLLNLELGVKDLILTRVG